jgi:hypothetical protein
MKYNEIPKNLGLFDVDVEEYFSYTYLPIKLPEQSKPTVENRLKVFDKLIGRACCDFIGDFGIDEYVNSYVYLTAKHQNQIGGKGFNREGWHSDGFMTKDISYIWSNKQPTIFNSGDFVLSQDDLISMEEMKEQADPKYNYSFPNNSLIRMNQYTIHKVGEYEEGNRAFIKLCFSRDVYNLKGNSINYDLDYKWEYAPRKKTRNIPQNNS